MEQQKLPNATISIVLGIISFIACFCSSGIGGLLFSGIALFLANKDIKLYNENPDLYDNYSQANTARIIAIIGLAIATIVFLYFVYMVYQAGGWSAYLEQQSDIMKQLGFDL
ncbi:CCC motif membrane protein [Ichthyenterobacterium sp. W332]|uniref:CCC motif membrane protein n=1 Tax=Microcosmobacter mediterraneus TaxID=3075607 RepID=A0ABU2YHZ8_9FLAO|nr:CCC motif membrane protein [Ichthyenterobacterium sp. W332]MDT0557432.1 CCC motif membrane protein [Ichthyenterobacterium sp. W332]